MGSVFISSTMYKVALLFFLGAASAGIPKCKVVWEEQCSYEPRQSCRSVQKPFTTTTYEQQCNTIQVPTVETVPEQKCTSVPEQKCYTKYEQECHTEYEQECNTLYEQECNDRQKPVTKYRDG